MKQEPASVAVNRPLSPLEKLMWRLSNGMSLNFTFVTRLRGPLADDRLAETLRCVAARHPFLRARIETGPSGPAFCSDGVGPLPFVTRTAPREAWAVAAEHEINTPIDWSAGPLMRFVCLHHGDESHHLLATFHHVIGDGMSGVFLMRDLLQNLGESASLDPLADTVPMDLRMPAYALAFPGLRRRVAMGLRFLWEDVRFRPPQRIRSDEDAPPNRRATRILPYEFDAEFTAALAERARREQTTLHGALAAAECLGVAHDVAGTRTISVKFQSPINARNGLEPPAGEDVGMFASMLFFRGRLSAADDFWSLARRIREQIEAGRQRQQHIAMVRLLPFLYRRLSGDRLSDEKLWHRWHNLTPSTVSLTNIGRLPVASRYGALAVEAMHFAVSPSALGDFTATAASVDGRLNWNFMCPVPAFTPDHAQTLVADIVDRLRRAM